MAQLSTDMNDPEARPYFLWSEPITVGQLRAILRGEQGPYLHDVYEGTLLREARIEEVWKFLTPQQIAQDWPRIQRYAGGTAEISGSTF